MLERRFYDGYCVDSTNPAYKEYKEFIDMENTIKARRQHWKDVCNEYLETFCKKHGYSYEPDMWVGSDPGTIAMTSDMFINMDDLRYDVDNEIPEEYFSKWYWKSVELSELGVKGYMNYPSYCKGAPDIWTEEKIEEIRKAHQRVEETKQQLEKLLEEYKNDKKLF